MTRNTAGTFLCDGFFWLFPERSGGLLRGARVIGPQQKRAGSNQRYGHCREEESR
jgi:hypothetical protein